MKEAKETIPLHRLTQGAAGVQVLRAAGDDPMLWQQLAAEVAVPHRHDHYSYFFIERGNVDLLVDFQPVHLAAPALLVSCPGQIHQLGAQTDYHGLAGWMLAADAKLISPQARSRIEQSRIGAAQLPLAANEADWFRHVFHALHAAAAVSHSSLLHTEGLHALLNACLCQAAALLEAQERQQLPARTLRGQALTKQFRQLVQQHFLTCKKPADYADKLYLTVSYLNDTVKAATGLSVSHFIRQEVLAEAQRLLFYTDLSIKEIADQLGYEDSKYFIRLFGRGVGISPARFRKHVGVYKQPA